MAKAKSTAEKIKAHLETDLAKPISRFTVAVMYEDGTSETIRSGLREPGEPRPTRIRKRALREHL